MSWGFLRALLPETWRVLFAASVFGMTLWGTLAVGRGLEPIMASQIQLLGWMMAGFLWTLLTGARACCLAYGMSSLRLPGVRRALLGGAGLHLLLALGLPLLALRLSCPQVDHLLLGGGLLLGCALAALLLVLPGYRWVGLAMIPAGFLIASHYPLWWPQTVGEYWGLGCTLLTVVALLWGWLCGPGRGWQPMEVGVDMPAVSALRAELQSCATLVASEPACAASDQRLVEVLGPGLKSISQLSSWRNCLLGGTFLLVCLGTVLWLEPDGGNRMLVGYGLVAFFVLMMSVPARYLLTVQASASQSLLAELLLLPGLPRQWLRMLCRQILRVMTERLALLGLMFSLVAWDYGFAPAWLLWFALLLLVLLPLSLLQALLVCGHSKRPRYWLVIDGVMTGLAIASSSLLLRGDGSAAAWLLPAWLALGVTFAGLCVIAYQRLSRRGAPFFS